jgi:two-component system, OmpR family, sensor kinase
VSGPAARGPVVKGWGALRTLRGRLIAGLVLLLAVACAAIGIVTYVVLGHTLIGQVDAQLRVAGGRYANCMEINDDIESGELPDGNNPRRPGDHGNGAASGGTGPALQDCNQVPGQAAGIFGARLKRGVVTAAGIVGDTNRLRLAALDRRQLARLVPDGRYSTMELVTVHGDYRLTAVPGHDHDVLITGVPLANEEATLRKVELAEIVVFAAALLFTGILGTGFVRLSLRPLRRVAATAARVTQLPLASGEVTLSERVPDTDSRTEVGQVGAAFNRMLGHVESALGRRAASEARLRRFAADASHELRTPLAAIRGYAELARRHPGPIPPDIAHALGRVESESARMSVLVDELLLLAQLDAGRPLASARVDLTLLAIDATSDARAARPDHRWRLELPDEPVMVEGDEHRLRQVLANLLSNAGKHTPAATTVTVGVTTAPGTVDLSVTDNGPGIPEDLQPVLFERFVRGDTARSPAGGSTGLGLAIVDAVTAAHGGKVTVASQPGLTRFTITLPRLPAPPASSDGDPDGRAWVPEGPAGTSPGRLRQGILDEPPMSGLP